MDLISRSVGVTAEAGGVPPLGWASLNCSEVPSSRNELGLTVGNSDPQINPKTYTEKTEYII